MGHESQIPWGLSYRHGEQLKMEDCELWPFPRSVCIALTWWAVLWLLFISYDISHSGITEYQTLIIITKNYFSPSSECERAMGKWSEWVRKSGEVYVTEIPSHLIKSHLLTDVDFWECYLGSLTNRSRLKSNAEKPANCCGGGAGKKGDGWQSVFSLYVSLCLFPNPVSRC